MEQYNAVVNSKDPLVALSFCRALIAAQQREDNHRHRALEQALEEWRIQRVQQSAALMRVLDASSAMGGERAIDEGECALLPAINYTVSNSSASDTTAPRYTAHKDAL